jgi:hypothetical protein
VNGRPQNNLALVDFETSMMYYGYNNMRPEAKSQKNVRRDMGIFGRQVDF